MNRPKSIALLVIGMHRSGTSAVAGSLAQLGMSLGRRLLAPGEDNPKGYFEHEEAVRLNDALLDGLDRSWDDPRDMPDGWMHSPAAEGARAAIGRLLAHDFSGVGLFALKDPRMCRLLPLWLEALRAADVEPRVLLVVRHPFEVAASLKRRNGFAPALSELLWLQHMLAAERDSRACPRAVLRYDDLVTAPEDALRKVATSLGLKNVASPGDGVLSDFVSADDRHFRGGSGLLPGTTLDEIAHDAFASFYDLPLDAARFDALRLRLHAQMSPAADLVAALATQALKMRRESIADEALMASQQSRLNAQIAWSEAAVLEREALQGQLSEVRAALNAQMAWSKDAVAEREQLQAELAEVRSSLAAQVAWSDAAVAEREALQAELAEVRSALSAQIAWSDAAVLKHEALQAELAGERSASGLQLERIRALELKISRYEATLVGRLQRRWLAWRDNRLNGERT